MHLFFPQTCSRVLLSNKERVTFRSRILNPNLPYLSKKALRKQILDKTKKVSVCPHCRSLNGVVKKCGMFKISHDKYRNKKKSDPVVTDKLGKHICF